MSDSTSRLPARPSIEQLRKQAKDLLRDHQAGTTRAAERFKAINPNLAAASRIEEVTLADAQFVLAREYGFQSWTELIRHIEGVLASGRLAQYEAIASDIVAAYHDDAAALQRLNNTFSDSLNLEQLRAMIRKRLGAVHGAAVSEVTPADARMLLARLHGFESWEKFAGTLAQPPSPPDSGSLGLSSTPPFFKIDWMKKTIEPRLLLSRQDWETVFDVMCEYRLTGLRANGQMTDAAMEGLAKLDHVTSLNLGGSKKLTDLGLQHLARMPQLLELDLSEYPGGRITDRGLEVLRHLSNLRWFQMCWQSGITDGGVSNLRFCEQLESVDLLGTPTGDGAIRALVGKPNLRRLKTGRQVTDAGIPLLHEFPVFKTWRGGEMKYSLMSPDAEPNHLLLDGPFTDRGLLGISGLDGLFGLSFFWHISAITAEGLKPLANLPMLGFLGCEGNLCNDVAMRHIAEIPGLRMLMGQGTVASDDGFAALSGSRTIEYIWGRECPNLRGRGFAALAQMPALKGLAVSCKEVDEAGLSALPRFPSLRGLMPMDVTDEGFRHVGRCENLEDLWCMYCRETGDVATEHIAGLSRLKTYYAGATRITDRSLEILSRVSSLERIEFYECAHITNSGVARLASLPKLREIGVGGSPNVTRDGMAVFPARVRVNYW